MNRAALPVITARQLAEELLKNPDDIVCFTSENFEHNNATLPMRDLNLIHRHVGRFQMTMFIDAFDREEYSKEIVIFDDKGNTNFVKI